LYQDTCVLEDDPDKLLAKDLEEVKEVKEVKDSEEVKEVADKVTHNTVPSNTVLLENSAIDKDETVDKPKTQANKPINALTGELDSEWILPDEDNESAD
jgi:SET domain-containing protein